MVTDRFRDGDNAVVMVFRPKAKKMGEWLRGGGGEGGVSIPGLARAIPMRGTERAAPRGDRALPPPPSGLSVAVR